MRCMMSDAAPSRRLETVEPYDICRIQMENTSDTKVGSPRAHMVRPGGALSSLLTHPEGPPSEARLPHASPHALKALPSHPESHFHPSSVEHQHGTSLQADRSERHMHPGVPCEALPAVHAHPLPDCSSLRRPCSPETDKESPSTPPGTPLNAGLEPDQTVHAPCETTKK